MPAKMNKISFFVHDLSSNPIGRAYPIAESLRRAGFEIEILGFKSKDELYPPYSGLFDYKTILGGDRFPLPIVRLARLATGDVIVCFKPLWDTFGSALIASGFGLKKLLIVDIEDDELWFEFKNIKHFLSVHVLRGWLYAHSIKYKYLLHPLVKLFGRKIVSSKKLQRRYGGTILLHGPDEDLFNPARPDLDRLQCRQHFNLPADVPLILFVGTPHVHKGIDLLTKAMLAPELGNYHLVLGGPQDNPAYLAASTALGPRCHLVGYVPNKVMPKLLAATDIVPIPQRANGYTNAQVPAKLLEAMAMAKAVVATRVGDLSYILGETEIQPRGWVIAPENVSALVDAIVTIMSDPKERQRRGDAARQFYLEHASFKANMEKFKQLLK